MTKKQPTGQEVDSLDQDVSDDATLAEAQVEDAGLLQEASAPAEEVAAETPVPVPEPQHPWQIGMWHDKPNYQCPHKRVGNNPKGRRCPMVTVDLEVLTDHVDKVHPFSWLEQQGV